MNKINSYVTKDQQIQQPYTCDISTTEEFNIAKNQQMQLDICNTGTSTEKSLVKQIMGKTDNRRNTCVYSKVQWTMKFGFTNRYNNEKKLVFNDLFIVNLKIKYIHIFVT